MSERTPEHDSHDENTERTDDPRSGAGAGAESPEEGAAAMEDAEEAVEN